MVYFGNLFPFEDIERELSRDFAVGVGILHDSADCAEAQQSAVCDEEREIRTVRKMIHHVLKRGRGDGGAGEPALVDDDGVFGILVDEFKHPFRAHGFVVGGNELEIGKLSDGNLRLGAELLSDFVPVGEENDFFLFREELADQTQVF